MALIALTDGTTTITLTDGTNHALHEGGWAPAVSYLDEATLGGSGPYADVEEALDSTLFAATSETGMTARLQAVQTLLLQARRWAQGAHGIPAVRLRYQPDGSALASPLEAAVLGMSGAPSVVLPNSWNDRLFVREVEGVGARFWRRGAWLGPEELSSVGSAVANPGLMSCTFSGGALPYPSPVWVEVRGLPGDIGRSLLLVTDTAGAIQVIPGESGAPVSGSVWQTLSLAGAHGGSVKRYDDTGDPSAGFFGRATLSFGTITLTAPLAQVWAVLRRSSGGQNAFIQMTLGPYSNPDFNPIVSRVVMPSVSTSQLVSLGLVPIPIVGSSWQGTLGIQILNNFTADGAAVIYLDTIVIADAERSASIMFDDVDIPTSGSHTDRRLRVDSRPLERPTGDARYVANSGAVQVAIPTRGSPNLHFSGGTLYASYLAPAGSDMTLGPNTALSLAAGRRRAYLVPE